MLASILVPADDLDMTTAPRPTRTTLDFEATAPVFETVERWAKNFRYKPVGTDADGTRRYRRDLMRPNTGPGELFASLPGGWAWAHLEVQAVETHVRLVVWLSHGSMLRVLGLGTPKEMGIESGGVRMMLARRERRDELNRLLKSLGGPTIE